MDKLCRPTAYPRDASPSQRSAGRWRLKIIQSLPPTILDTRRNQGLMKSRTACPHSPIKRIAIVQPAFVHIPVRQEPGYRPAPRLDPALVVKRGADIVANDDPLVLTGPSQATSPGRGIRLSVASRETERETRRVFGLLCYIASKRRCIEIMMPKISAHGPGSRAPAMASSSRGRLQEPPEPAPKGRMADDRRST